MLVHHAMEAGAWIMKEESQQATTPKQATTKQKAAGEKISWSVQEIQHILQRLAKFLSQ